MSYKIFYNSGNDNNYFDACRQTAGAPLWKVYKCCQAQCSSSPVCDALCAQVYPGTIKEDCAFESGCWMNGFDKECLETNQSRIRKCCMDTCKNQGARVSPSIINSTALPTTDIPICDRFCDEYEVV